ncbi:hypothetical protein D9757_004548 [Collybiopsis confluens]|uniref:Uncharacterized protein n=1 Tax=Collybiopsis confluens TaxID=2823264 RepID=A0A8H5HWR8_9AGAR|nr:hypothetical protein D9757_004548 [Collybiopsis confluens]
MTELPSERPASPYGLAHPNFALLKITSENSEDGRGLYNPLQQFTSDTVKHNPKQLAGDTSIRSNVRGGYMQILSLFLLAVLMACMNHAVFTHLNGKEPGSHTSQFWVTVLKNVFPAAVAFLLFMGLKMCLSQAALYCIRLHPYPLELVNFVTSPPSLLNTLAILFKSSMRISLMCFACMAAITQAIALTSLFAPGTLSVVPTPSRIQTLTVPNIDFNVANPKQSSSFSFGGFAPFGSNNSSGTYGTPLMPQFAFIEPSQRWRRLIVQAASSNSAPAWDPPTGCGSSCSYSFSYFAPALNCTELSKEDIWPSAPNANDSLLPNSVNGTLYPYSLRYFFYNSTANLVPLQDNSEFLYPPNPLRSSWTYTATEVVPDQWIPHGVHCISRNATYEATTVFSNNTQLSSTQTSATNASLAFTSIIKSLSDILQGHAYYEEGTVNTSGTQAIYTPLFELASYTNDIDFGNLFGAASLGATTFSLAPALRDGLAVGLQDLLGNATLAFVNEQMSSTYANVTVTPESTQYLYISWRLGLIYGVVFSFSLGVIAYGLFCLQKNGTLVTFDLQNILEMTASSARLHEAAAQPNFGSTLVTGITSSELEGSRRRITVVLEVSN